MSNLYIQKEGIVAKKYRCSFSFEHEKIVSADAVLESMKDAFIDRVETEKNTGLRKPQYGALSAIRAFWTVGSEPVTVVLPTGTGKSETMLATIASENIRRTLIVVPNKLLRDQTYDRAKQWGILREIGNIKKQTLFPNTVSLISNSKEDKDFIKVINQANIIISTMYLLDRMNETQKKYLASKCDLLIVDEAHHISSKTWNSFKKLFIKRKILQFTATPYRQDGKLVDGKIIYNFPMHLAIEQDYFKPIDFISVEEYDERKSDLAVAKKAIAQLESDLENGFDHILLVRANTITRADELHKKIYSSYKQYSPVLITSSTKKSDKDRYMQMINDSISRIIICVDMFGEGIDIPKLKIAALHDKYKSLPITLQFIGRFARAKKELGNAKVIANIADVNIMDSLRELYEKDADWNKLLPTKSESNIQDKITLQELIQGFNDFDAEIDLKQLRPKVSMKAYRYKEENWYPHKWSNLFDETNSRCYINDDEKILIIVEPVKASQGWTTQRNIESLNWNFYIIYWNVEKKYVCVNSSDHQKAKALLEQVFYSDELTPIQSEIVFRCLSNVKRLVFASVGLNSAIDGPVRYKMFAGIDVAEGITESTKSNCYKSNVFGVGYEGDGRVSIGCSYKGKIWSRWVEDISFWKNWCDRVMSKILDDRNDSTILDNVLVPEVVSEFPQNQIAYRIDFDDSLFLCNSKISITTQTNDYNIINCELRIGEYDITNSNLKFFVCLDDEKFEYSIAFLKEKFRVSYLQLDHKQPELHKYGRNPILLSEYFGNNPPIIWYVGGASLQGNVYLKPYKRKQIYFKDSHIRSWDWKALGVDIRIESQLCSDGSIKENSIQYATINNIRQTNDYDVIFDDDGSGEIADIVAIKDLNNEILVELYHCKYSSSLKPGARVTDIYEVCGQAEKSVFWKSLSLDMFDRMKYRNAQRLSRNNTSRFVVGDIDVLNILQKKALQKPIKFSIFLVQPGIDSEKISEDIRTVIGATSAFCMDTFSVSVELICS